MPRFCGVIGCSSRENKTKKSFFRLPAARKYIDPDLTRLRRLKWLSAIRREDLTESKMKYLWICEDHFILGKPADLRDMHNPDWVPSLKLGYDKVEALSLCKSLTDSLYENTSQTIEDFLCLNKDNRTSKLNKQLLISGQITTSCPQFCFRTIKERNDQNTLFHKKSSIEETFTYQSLLKMLPSIKTPNNFWGIIPHLNVVICARWNEDYTCAKRVVIDDCLTVRVFLKEIEINLSSLMEICCTCDIANLLEKVEGYEVA